MKIFVAFRTETIYNNNTEIVLKSAVRRNEQRSVSSVYLAAYIQTRGGRRMDYITGNSELMMERSMQFLWSKQTAILDNISNAETPGYKTKYVTFEDSLKNSLQSASGSASPAAAFREALNGAYPTVHTADSESTRMDGNGVNLTEQGVELARNTYQLRYAMNSIDNNLNILRTAIKG